MLEGTRSARVALGETLRLALDALRAHKLRSFLTLLGIILAVTTLVAVMSVVSGLNLYVSDKIANFGANVFILDRFGIITSYEAWLKAQKRPPLTVEDYQALQDEMRLAERIAALESQVMDVRYENQLFEDVNVIGVTPNYPELRSIEVAHGRGLTEADELHRQPVCFIGADVANRFFPNVDPIGKTVRAGNQTYLVVGVAKAIGTVLGISQDQFLLIPFATFEKIYHVQTGSILLFVQARNTELMGAAEDEARMLLRARHHLDYNAPDDFGIVTPSSLMSLWAKLTGNIFALAVSLTSVFLVVGGIVIMNIMLASVTERTREIGIRKALGARRRHIIMQFLVESAVLSAAGGLTGLILAEGIAALVRATTPMPISTPLSAIFTSLALSTSVGLFFGIYPAMRAARLDPIEALRQEI